MREEMARGWRGDGEGMARGWRGDGEGMARDNKRDYERMVLILFYIIGFCLEAFDGYGEVSINGGVHGRVFDGQCLSPSPLSSLLSSPLASSPVPSPLVYHLV